MKWNLAIASWLLLALGAQSQSDAAKDPRSRLKTLNDTDYHLKVPPTKDDWLARKAQVKKQLLIAAGLWPMPAPISLKPVTTSKVERDAYTIENVWFESRPGQLVTGSLYIPKEETKKAAMRNGKVPAVLCPDGHWTNARWFQTADKDIPPELKSGGESRVEGAKFPLQARCAQLARMGCIVFQYDMLGNSDNRAIAHSAGFGDPQAELWSLNWFGLQTLNSIRALDYVLSLPGVDSERIGMTGASGGGTQTFILGAIDDRVTADFPAVMVGTRMQGGCVCENASWLRVGTGNIELAGMFAPRPMAMSGANDWTVAIEKEGYPELKKLYGLFDKTDLVKAKCWPEFGHNYNQVAREFMYNWFNEHLALNQPSPVKEALFVPVDPKELQVFAKDAPLPAGILSAPELRATLVRSAQAQLDSIKKDCKAGSTRSLETFLDPILEMAVGAWPLKDGKGVESKGSVLLKRQESGDLVRLHAVGDNCNLKGPMNLVVLTPEEFKAFKEGKTAGWVTKLTERGEPVFVIEPFGIRPESQARATMNNRFGGYVWGYNRPLVAERARDIQTAMAWMYSKESRPRVHAKGKAAVPAALALAASPGKCQFASLDLAGFRFEDLKDLKDERFLPGALRWGGMGALLARGLPRNRQITGAEGTGVSEWVR